MTWPAIIALALGAFAFKALGVLWSPPRDIGRYTSLIPAALLAGLIVVLTFDSDGSLAIDARLAGAAVAAVAAWRQQSFVVVVILAMVVTAGVRAVA